TGQKPVHPAGTVRDAVKDPEQKLQLRRLVTRRVAAGDLRRQGRERVRPQIESEVFDLWRARTLVQRLTQFAQPALIRSHRVLPFPAREMKKPHPTKATTPALKPGRPAPLQLTQKL